MPKRGEHLSNPEESILAQTFVEGILKQARENLRKDGAVAPILFLQFQGGEGGVLPLELPETHEERRLYFTAIGLAFLGEGTSIDEALFLSETWYVGAEKHERLTLDVAPSKHPHRREAITIVGRDAARSRYAMVILPFGRDAQQKPLFESLAVAEYNTFGILTSGPVGLLDYLFPKRSRILHA